jgi:hypothetical protein
MEISQECLNESIKVVEKHAAIKERRRCIQSLLNHNVNPYISKNTSRETMMKIIEDDTLFAMFIATRIRFALMEIAIKLERESCQ